MYVLYSIAWSGAFFADFDGRCAPCVPGVIVPLNYKRGYAITPKRQNHQNLSDFIWSLPHTTSLLFFLLLSNRTMSRFVSVAHRISEHRVIEFWAQTNGTARHLK